MVRSLLSQIRSFQRNKSLLELSQRGNWQGVVIERKASVEEIANNLGKKKSAFLSEMERMQEFKYPFMVLEFSMEDLLKFPENSKIPKNKLRQVRITGKYLLKSLVEFQLWYNTKII